jgi:hypothetical protein
MATAKKKASKKQTPKKKVVTKKTGKKASKMTPKKPGPKSNPLSKKNLPKPAKAKVADSQGLVNGRRRLGKSPQKLEQEQKEKEAQEVLKARTKASKDTAGKVEEVQPAQTETQPEEPPAEVAAEIQEDLSTEESESSDPEESTPIPGDSEEPVEETEDDAPGLHEEMQTRIRTEMQH